MTTMPNVTKLVILRYQVRTIVSAVTLTPQDVDALLDWCSSVDSDGVGTEPVLVVHGRMQVERFDLTPARVDALVRLAFAAEGRVHARWGDQPGEATR